MACKLADLLQGAAVVELLEKGPQCLPNAKAFNRNQALQALQRRDVRLRCHCQVLMVAANELQLQQEGADLEVSEGAGVMKGDQAAVVASVDAGAD